MNWEEPAVIEIKMDAEIGSYQDDFDGREEPPIVRAATLAGSEA